MDPWVLLFWFSNGVLALTYIVYPFAAAAAVAFKGSKSVHRASAGNGPVRVAFVIPAYNEESVIGEKIRNTLGQRHPDGWMKVIVVTDGSRDRTADIVSSHPGVLHLHAPERRGKSHAMNRGAAAMGDAEVLVFSDANALLSEDALMLLLAPFSDPEVGAVSGEKRVRSSQGSPFFGEGVYWGYESRLKSIDSALRTVVGPVGELMAVRARLWQPLPEDVLLDDLHVGLRICMAGGRVAYAPEAVAVEPPSRSLSEEWERKVRISAGAFQSLGRFLPLLNPFRHGIVSIQFLFRKVMRWTLCPPALLTVLPAAVHSAGGGHEPVWIHRSALVCWALFFVLATAGWMLRGTRPGRIRILQVPFHFVFMHAATLVGLWRHLSGTQSVTWRKADR